MLETWVGFSARGFACAGGRRGVGGKEIAYREISIAFFSLPIVVILMRGESKHHGEERKKTGENGKSGKENRMLVLLGCTSLEPGPGILPRS